MDVKGRDLVTAFLRSSILTRTRSAHAIQEQIDTIVAAVKTALEQTPP